LEDFGVQGDVYSVEDIFAWAKLGVRDVPTFYLVASGIVEGRLPAIPAQIENEPLRCPAGVTVSAP
jgi:hypothetical protein